MAVLCSAYLVPALDDHSLAKSEVKRAVPGHRAVKHLAVRPCPASVLPHDTKPGMEGVGAARGGEEKEGEERRGKGTEGTTSKHAMARERAEQKQGIRATREVPAYRVPELRQLRRTHVHREGIAVARFLAALALRDPLEDADTQLRMRPGRGRVRLAHS